MISKEQDVEIQALRARGWSISAIARHCDLDRKTIRNYLSGKRTAKSYGPRSPSVSNLEGFIPYIKERFRQDPHLWGTVLFDEITAAGYLASYPSFMRQLAKWKLRPICTDCITVKNRYTTTITHDPGEEIQWDFLELNSTLSSNGKVHLLVGTLPYSSKCRGYFLESEDQAELISGIDEILRRFGGTGRTWRFDRMATVIEIRKGKILDSFLEAAKYYKVKIVVCPPRSPWRKGSVESTINYLTQRWWRSHSSDSLYQSQKLLDIFCEQIADKRSRPVSKLIQIGIAPTYDSKGRVIRPKVAELASLERLMPLPKLAFPVNIFTTRTVSAQSTISFSGNYYSVPLGLLGQEVTVKHRVAEKTIEIFSTAGISLRSHSLVPAGLGMIVRDVQDEAELSSHIFSLNKPPKPHGRKPNIKPGPYAMSLLGNPPPQDSNDHNPYDLTYYENLVQKGQS